jgi:photosystem II stability/assembly factor-like uncharacterized protein
LPPDGQVSAALWIEGAKSALIAFAGGHLYLSRDDLQQWTESGAGLPAKSEIQALVASADGRAIYAGTSQGLYTSGDNGRTWAGVGGGLPTGSVGALTGDPHQPDAVYAAIQNMVYASTDRGATWRVVASALDKPALAITVATNRAQQPVTYATSGQLYRYPSTGGGSGALPPLIIVLLAALVVAALFIRSRRGRRDRPAPAAPRTPPVTDTRSPAERYGDADLM